MGKTLFEKVWDAHVVAQDEGAPAVLYIDTHLIHEVTSPQAFTMLRERDLKVRRPERTFATMDHSIPTRMENRKMLFRSRCGDQSKPPKFKRFAKTVPILV